MTAPIAAPLLRIPPFPGARVQSLAKTRTEDRAPLTDDQADRLALALTESKVGGSYWASQPAVPAIPYTLVRTKDAGELKRAIAEATSERPVVCWAAATPAASGASARVHLLEGPADPWHLLEGADRVIVDADDELALLAMLAGVAVTCVGSGRFQALESGGASARRGVVRAIDELRYENPFTGQVMTVEEAIALCGFWRRLIDSNRDISAAIGFAFWKRPTVAPLLWSGSSPVSFVSSAGLSSGRDRFAVWKSRADPATLEELQSGKAQTVEVEDGFIRSAGLGADCIPPLSIIVDRLGVYFDPNRPSDLEQLLQGGEFNSDMLDRARRLRALIVELGVSKYASGVSPLERRTEGKRHLLVPGQVEDDRSVVCGGGAVSTNMELLQRVRQRNPDVHIIYKPHPDVEAGHRLGAIADSDSLGLADEIVRTESISSLIDMVDEVHVNTSLAGFEALLRSKPVITYGVPFYAGWGLTRDLGSIPGCRTARRTLDELVAAALLLYPRYLDPVTGLPCPPEILIRRLSEGDSGQAGGPLVWLRRLQGRANRAVSKMLAR